MFDSVVKCGCHRSRSLLDRQRETARLKLRYDEATNVTEEKERGRRRERTSRQNGVTSVGLMGIVSSWRCDRRVRRTTDEEKRLSALKGKSTILVTPA